MAEPDVSAQTLAKRRWSTPSNVDRRVDALARRIQSTVQSLPPLTDAQRRRLAQAFRQTQPND